MMSRFDLRRKVTSFKQQCTEINAFPEAGGRVKGDWYLRVRSPETIHRQPSITTDADDAARFEQATLVLQRGSEFTIPEIFLACLDDARLVSHDCFVVSSNQNVFLESALSGPEILEANGILDRWTLPRPKRVQGQYCLISHPWSQRYYHWVIESLPRLAILERFPQLSSVPLIVLGPLLGFQRESFKLAEVPSERIVEFDGDCWQLEKLYFPQVPAPSGNPSPHAVAWLRQRFLKREDLSPTASEPRRLYLTRRDAAQRRLLNEPEIIEYLRGLGFEIICPGEMSFAEQIQTFRNAEIVVAPHGAAATNMVFAPAGATLIELFGDNYINGCYWALANICSQKHAFLTGTSQWLDYSISLASLKKLLEKVITS